jgi:DNA-binding IclR family transcriptional regulator
LEEVVLLAVLANGRRVTLAQVDPHRTIRVDPDAGVALNPYEMATGRILLAFATEAERRQVIDRYGLPGTAWDGIRSETALRAALDELRRDGVCPMEKKEDGLMAFAVPIAAGDGSLIGALGCYAPTFRCPASKGQSIVEEMKRTAAAMAERMATQY